MNRTRLRGIRWVILGLQGRLGVGINRFKGNHGSGGGYRLLGLAIRPESGGQQGKAKGQGQEHSREHFHGWNLLGVDYDNIMEPKSGKENVT